eukprot:1140866-Pelagomonas_calceolata.AAC.2
MPANAAMCAAATISKGAQKHQGAHANLLSIVLEGAPENDPPQICTGQQQLQAVQEMPQECMHRIGR